MSGRRARQVTSCGVKLVALALVLAGCYDMERIDPGPAQELLLGDFEDGTSFAPYPLEKWDCSTFNPEDKDRVAFCELVPDFATNDSSMRIEFSLELPPDGKETGGGIAALGVGALDLSEYRELVFDAKLSISGAVKTEEHYAELGCKEAESINPTESVDLFVTQHVEMNSDWKTFYLPLRTFVEPSWRNPLLVGGPAACLPQVDSVRFSIAVEMDAGELAHATLQIDNVRVR